MSKKVGGLTRVPKADWPPQDWNNDGEEFGLKEVGKALNTLGHEEGQECYYLDYLTEVNKTALIRLIRKGFELRLLRPCRENGNFTPPEYGSFGIFAIRLGRVYSVKLESVPEYQEEYTEEE